MDLGAFLIWHATLDLAKGVFFYGTLRDQKNPLSKKPLSAKGSNESMRVCKLYCYLVYEKKHCRVLIIVIGGDDFLPESKLRGVFWTSNICCC